MSNKIINFYYSLMNDHQKTVYRCLHDNDDDITEVKKLNYTKYKNFSMTSDYSACDEDLYKFRDDLIRHNEEIKAFFFKNKDKKVFKIDVFHYHTTNEAVYKNIMMNANIKAINDIENIDFKEFQMMENVLSSGLITFDRTQNETPVNVYGYDYVKFYYNMMRKIRIPLTAPTYQVINEIDFNKLSFGYYRCKIICKNKLFWNVFNFNDRHFYNHNTLKILYKFKDKYNIKFKLLEPDELYDYNMVLYENTGEVKRLFSGWFNVCDKLLEGCDKSVKKGDKKNWLLKAYVSQSWGNLCKYSKTYVDKSDIEEYDWGHLHDIYNTNKQYEYYNYKTDNNRFVLIDSNKPFKYGGIARLKPFLTEYSRMYIFNMLSENDLESHVVRIQTDSVCFNKPVNFKSMSLDYFPILEKKSTGLIKFYNVNTYNHVCPDCDTEYKYDKEKPHKCKNC